MFEAPATAPMELRDYFAILRRRAWVVVLVTVVVVGAAAAWSFSRPDQYRASGTLILESSGTAGDVANQSSVIQSSGVDSLAREADPDAGSVNAEPSTTGSTITVTATSRDPRQAAATVNSHLDAYLTYLRQQAQKRFDTLNAALQPQIAALQQQIAAIDAQTLFGAPAATTAGPRASASAQLEAMQAKLQDASLNIALATQDVQITNRAEPPASRSSPNPRTDLLVALGAGLLLGVIVAFLLEFLDDSIRGRQDLLAAASNSVPVMGVIPATRSYSGVVSISSPQSPAAEAYRSLRTAVNFAQLNGKHCIEVTSTKSRDGKTETAANLAVLAARAGQRVVIVDCDLRFPRVHDYFGLSNEQGFTSVVQGEQLSSALQRVPGIERLYVLPSGPIPGNPSELLATERCHEVLASLQADDTLVILDTPPVLAVTDAAALASSAGGILIVASAKTTRRKQVRQALDVLRQVGAPILGLVLYRADSAEIDGYGKGTGRRERRKARRRSAEPSVSRADVA
jgi:tyrosine-protein kinase